MILATQNPDINNIMCFINFRLPFMSLSTTKNIRIVNNVNDFQAFHPFRDEIINNEFKFSLALKKGAVKYLHNVRKLWQARRLLQIMQYHNEEEQREGNNSSRHWKFPSESSVTFVSVHIRRGDYAGWLLKNLKGYVVSKLFFEKAMDWFRRRVCISSISCFIEIGL